MVSGFVRGPDHNITSCMNICDHMTLSHMRELIIGRPQWEHIQDEQRAPKRVA